MKLGRITRSALTIIALTISGTISAFSVPKSNDPAQPEGSRDSIVLNFRFEKSLIDSSFLSNKQALARIDSVLSHSDPALIDSIVIYGYSSPDGPYDANWRVAGERAESVKKYIISHFRNIDESCIYTYNMGEDIAGLRNMVAVDNNMPGRDNVIMLIDSGMTGDTLEDRIDGAGQGGIRYIVLNMSRFLRSSVIYVIYTAPGQKPADGATGLQPQELGPADQADQTTAEPAGEQPAATKDAVFLQPASVDPGFSATKIGKRRFPFMGLKTNLLYYPILMPNIEAEYYIGRRWSANVEYQIAWWQFPHHDRFYQVQTGGPEFRYWLRPDGQFTGHYFGVYGTVGLYDLKNGEKGYMSNSLWSTGISWGYLLPLNGRLSLEFGLALGYMHTSYDEYVRNYDLGKHYDYLYTSKTSYFGPTKVKIGLVFRTGQKGKR